MRGRESSQQAVAREDPEVGAHESAQQAVARKHLVVRAHESSQRAVARSETTHEMACKCINGAYIFHQPRGL
jgi:hypothetical protein